ncbi:MAG: hypothetical protein ACP6IY_17245 [Promethearchaeia archaeon]
MNNLIGDHLVRVSHDLQRQILEIPSLFRVMNNYYRKKLEIQEQIKPLILKKFREGLKTLEDNKDWLFSLPTALTTLNEYFVKNKDSFRFPDSILLFEAWMNLGFDALYPRVVFHFKFPGLLKGEKIRNVFQFIYATSRGFGFPIYFGPEFYDYHLTIGKIIEPIFKWVYTLCRKANKAIFLISDRKLKAKRHHPGEFESVIISEYKNNIFKGIDTLLHGYFTPEPKFLGVFNSLYDALDNVIFSYSIGDHAMSVEKKFHSKTLKVPLVSYDNIVKNYDVDFYSYIRHLINVNILINKKIQFYRKKRKIIINKLKLKDKIKLRLEQSKKLSVPHQKLSEKFSEIEKYLHYKNLLEKLRELLWTTPLYTHTIHVPSKNEEIYFLYKSVDDKEDAMRESTESILLSFIKKYEKEHDFQFEEKDVVKELKNLRDRMARMWLYFKEKHFRYAVKKLEELCSYPIEAHDYREKVNSYIDKLIPIISIYEIFHRPLSESVYPEAIPQTKRFIAYIASFLTSKYNPFGINLIKLFNRLAFRNWAYLIVKRKYSRKQFFNFVLKLPIWNYIPISIKKRILNY